MSQITLTINNETRTVTAPPMKRLLDVLREDLRLTGAKEGCGEGECGSCSVIMNGELVNSASPLFAASTRNCSKVSMGTPLRVSSDPHCNGMPVRHRRTDRQLSDSNHFTQNVTPTRLSAPPTLRATEPRSPAGKSAGIRAFTCRHPTRPGASPAYSTSAATFAIFSTTGSAGTPSGLPAAAPVAAPPFITPAPTAKNEITLPRAAALVASLTLPSCFSTAACDVPSSVSNPGAAS